MHSIPFWRKAIAAAKPAGPPPIITTSSKFALMAWRTIRLIFDPYQMFCDQQIPALE
jgi:hypothetical protein